MTPPEFYIDKGACPGECCTYREWTVQKVMATYARPDLNSARVGNLRAGTKVIALTGEVHTIPSRFVIKKAYEKYQPGDILWVYTYIGEGHFKIWFKGKMYQEALGFSPYGGSPGERCETSVEYCWGELDRKLRMTWWIKIKSKDGRIGWTNQGENFRGADACG
jgi:hypothetical protein